MEEEGEGEHSVSIPDELQSEMEEEGEGEHSVSIPDELQSEMEEEGEGEHSVSIPDELQSEMEEEGEGEHSVSIPDELQSEMEEEGEGEHSVLIPDELQSEMEEEGEGEHSVSIPDELQSEMEEEGEGEHSVLIPDELQSEIEEEGEGEHSVSIPDELQSEIEEEGEGEHSASIPVPNESQLEKPTHLLDLQRKVILTTSNSKNKSNEAADMKWSQKLLQKIKIWSRKLLQKITNWKWKLYYKIMKWIGKKSKRYVVPFTYRNIQDLKAVGIRLKTSMTQRPRDIDFCGGWFAAELTLPMIIVTNGSAHMFLNLIAYEMCPDFENDYEICSFLAFMDSLIDHPEDVKELRSNGILLNKLGSDEEVAHLFNIISTDLVRNTYIYHDVKWKINDHYCNKYKTWIAQGFHTYFNSPWAIIAFIAAVVVLVLTFIQTWFTIHPTSK
ncbi:UPF0481 protein At3g47200 [Medicago truncatula]|uniref:UPF0481 protein At3g47200 n=1 Tax=Medicago truncatula TaxID=3880 RepID=UPI001966E4D5|nr:UPF0481 protein At3g47200 [Medicago truncatula]